MKLLQFEPPGQELPGFLDADGHIRDPSGYVADIGSDALAPAASLHWRRWTHVACRALRKYPAYLRHGDVMTLGIAKLGSQRQEVTAWHPIKEV